MIDLAESGSSGSGSGATEDAFSERAMCEELLERGSPPSLGRGDGLDQVPNRVLNRDPFPRRESEGPEHSR